MNEAALDAWLAKGNTIEQLENQIDVFDNYVNVSPYRIGDVFDYTFDVEQKMYTPYAVRVLKLGPHSYRVARTKEELETIAILHCVSIRDD